MMETPGLKSEAGCSKDYVVPPEKSEHRNVAESILNTSVEESRDQKRDSISEDLLETQNLNSIDSDDTLREVRYFNDLHIFDLDQFKWQEIKPPPGCMWPSPRSGFQFVVYQDEIYLYGGYSKEVSSDKSVSEKGIVHSDIWCLDPWTWEWNKLKKSSDERDNDVSLESKPGVVDREDAVSHVDELYLLCELECDNEQMKEAILLEEAASDFRELNSRSDDILEKYAKSCTIEGDKYAKKSNLEGDSKESTAKRNQEDEMNEAYAPLHYLLNPRMVKRMRQLLTTCRKKIPTLNLEDKVNLRGRDVMYWTISI